MSSEAFKAITLDRILAGRNLWEAMKKVQANKGSPGVDGMKTEELKEYFFENPGKLTAMIRQGEYRPLPIHTERQWRAETVGNTDGHRPICPAGSGTGAERRIRKTLQGYELWLSSEQKLSTRSTEGDGACKGRIHVGCRSGSKEVLRHSESQ